MADPAVSDDAVTTLCLADGRSQQLAILRRQTSRAALTQAQAARAARLNPRYRAFSSLNTETAVRLAEAADARHGNRLTSPVDGLALSVKGSIPVAGQRWTEGSRLFADRIASENAAAVARLTAAGALFLGTTTLSELAFYAPDNPFEPLALNPWAPARTSGGSTAGGGAAAALGLGALHLGTDAGGSIRNPACHCGAVGFKPTLSRWPADGVPNYAPSVGAMGIITRSVADVIATDDVLADAPADRAEVRSVLVPEKLVSRYADAVTQQLFGAAVARLRAAGFAVETFDEPTWEAGERAAGLVSIAEGSRSMASFDRGRMATGLGVRLDRAALLPPEEIEAARASMALFRAALIRNVPQKSVILTPTWPFRAPRIYQTAAMVQGRRVPMDPHRNIFVRAANAADAPALSLPAGLYPGGVPFGLHVMAPQGRDGDVLAAAQAIEASLAMRLTLPQGVFDI